MDKQLIEFCERNRVYISDYIKFSDAKSGLIMVFLGTIFGVAGYVWSEFSEGIGRYPEWFHGAVIAISIWVVFSISLSIYRALCSLSPRVDDAQFSLASFPDIASISAIDYLGKLRCCSESDLVEEYAKINSTLSKIALNKFSHVKKSLYWMMSSIFGLVGLVFICAVSNLF